MTANETHHVLVKSSRALTAAAGGTMILIALIAHRLGWSTPGGLGRGQLLLCAAGLIAMLVAVLGRRFGRLYKGVAIILLNTLVLFAFLEMVSIIVVRTGRLLFPTTTPMARYAALPYYQAHDWSTEYLREQTLYAGREKRYRPYILWRGGQFEGTTTTVDQHGIRRTPGADCRSEAYKVFAFGGSTMWGWGAPDWGTIPAYLQAGFAALTERPICVMNFGQDAFVSTQSLIELLMQLQAGNRPDLVLFYDGVNEVYAAYQSGQPRLHADFYDISTKFEGDRHLFVEWLKTSRLFSLLTSVVSRLDSQPSTPSLNAMTYRTMGVDAATLANSVIQTYLGNYELVEALAQVYEFEFFFFWQPSIAVGDKSLTSEEQQIQSELDPALVDLYQAIYRRIEQTAPAFRNLYDLADILDSRPEQIWIDTWGHVTPIGNRLIAEGMLGIITGDLQTIDFLR